MGLPRISYRGLPPATFDRVAGHLESKQAGDDFSWERNAGRQVLQGRAQALPIWT